MDIDARITQMSEGPRFDLDAGGLSYRSLTLDELRARGVPADEVLGVLKRYLKSAVDATAEALRSSIATAGAGQAMEYQEAASQAAAALKAPSSATAAKYPMLAATIGVDMDPNTGAPAQDVLGVARAVDGAYEQWGAAGAAIRGIRLAGKKAIDDAETEEAAAEAYGAIAWPNFG